MAAILVGMILVHRYANINQCLFPVHHPYPFLVAAIMQFIIEILRSTSLIHKYNYVHSCFCLVFLCAQKYKV